ncbi:MAG: HU family DNA-binding protein [Alphaproteobacteria bacterium]|nr:HU family DNA-binding protein [Alphaproteobacteria bacterium]MBV9694946.1 HU family DNA-binding protein [Alphaproteobacteria bacterium]
MRDEIAKACDSQTGAVAAIQKETFARIRTALESGENVQIPEFGKFSVRDLPAEGEKPARKVVRFRAATEKAAAGENGTAREPDGDVETLAGEHRGSEE